MKGIKRKAVQELEEPGGRALKRHDYKVVIESENNSYIQSGDFNLEERIFVICDDNTLRVFNQNGTPHKDYIIRTAIKSGFSVSLSRVVLIPVSAKSYVLLLDLNTGQTEEFRVITEAKVSLCNPDISGGFPLVWPYVGIIHGGVSIWNLETHKPFEGKFVREISTLPLSDNLNFYLKHNRLIKWNIGNDGLMEVKELSAYESFGYKYIFPLSEKRSVSSGSDMVFRKGTKVTAVVSGGIRLINNVASVKDDNDRFLVLGWASPDDLNNILQLWNFPSEEGKVPHLLQTFHLLDNYSGVISLNTQEVILIGRVGIRKLNFTSGALLAEGAFVKVHNLIGQEYFKGHSKGDNKIFLQPNFDKRRTLGCLLLSKLERQLPRDLVMETFTFF